MSLLPTRPTPAMVRAAVVGCGALAMAVLLGRPPLLLVGLPLLAWALTALALRILRGQEGGIAAPEVLPGRRTIQEGGASAVSLRASSDALTSVTVPLQPGALLSPRQDRKSVV